MLLDQIAIAIAHILVGNPEPHATPTRRHIVGWRQATLDLGLPLQLHAVDTGALIAAILGNVLHAGEIVRVMTIHVVAAQRDREMVERLDGRLEVDALGVGVIDERLLTGVRRDRVRHAVEQPVISADTGVDPVSLVLEA